MRFKLVGEPERSRATILAVVAVISVLIATLYPFNPHPPNRVSWVKGARSLNFDKAGLVLSRGSLRLAPAVGTPCTLELFVRPAEALSASTILGFYSPHREKQLLVGQYYGNGLMITHEPGVESDQTGTVEIDVAHIFRPGVPVFISISSGANGTTVFTDGNQRARFPKFTISQDDILGQTVIGTSPVGYDPWRGELRGLAIYGRELSSDDALQHFRRWIQPDGDIPDLRNSISAYAFAEGAGREVRNEVAFSPDLYIPKNFKVPHKSFLQSPAKEFKADQSYVRDVLINVAGFLPLGLILCAFFTWTRDRRNAILGAVMACAILSLLIEMLQYYIPPRGSGITDVITNTLGAAVGASLMQSGGVRQALRHLKVISLDAS